MSENVHTYARYIYPYNDAKMKAWAKTAVLVTAPRANEEGNQPSYVPL